RMKVAVVVNTLGLGGTEKAACRWAWGLKDRGHEVNVITFRDGQRRAELFDHGINVALIPETEAAIRVDLDRLRPDAIHAHAPGHPHMGDGLGPALAGRPKIPVVQTN